MDSWEPITPQKPIPTRSGLIPIDRHGNQPKLAEWEQLAGLPTGYVQETRNYSANGQNLSPIEQMGQGGEADYSSTANLAERNKMNMINIAGSYMHDLHGENAGWNHNTLGSLLGIGNAGASASGTRNASISMVNGLLTPNLHHPQGGGWGLSNSGNLMLATEPHCLSFDFSRHNDGFHQIPLYEFPIPDKPMYNLNSPPRTSADAASNIADLFQLTPLTPQPSRNVENKQLSEAPTLTDESSNHDKEKQTNLITFMVNEVTQQNCYELLQNIVDSSSVVISTPCEENKDDSGENHQAIDLNKTPQQKQPKRRKHRPKVVTEGKPKRKATATPKTISSEENPSGKRKYVRRKGLNEPAIQQADSTRESDPTATPKNISSEEKPSGKRKYVKRKGLNELATQQAGSTRESDPNAGTVAKRKYVRKKGQKEPATEQEDLIRGPEHTAGTATKRKYTRKKAVKESVIQQADCMGDTDPSPGTAVKSCRRILNFDFEKTGDKSQSEVANQQEMHEGNKNDSHSQAIGLWNEMISSTGPNSYMQSSQQNGQATENRSKGFVQSCSQGGYNCKKIDRIEELMSQRASQSVSTILLNTNDCRGSKREHCPTLEQGQSHTVSPVVSLISQEIFQMNECCRNVSTTSAGCLGSHKRKKTDNGSDTNMYGIPSSKESVNDGLREAQTKGTYNVNAGQLVWLGNCGTSDPHFVSNSMGREKSSEVNEVSSNRHTHSMDSGQALLKQHVPTALPSVMKMAETKLTQVKNVPAVEKSNNLMPATPEKVPTTQFRLASKASHANVPEENNTEPTLLRKTASGTGRMLQEHKEAMHGNQSTIKARGSSVKEENTLMDQVIDKMKGINLKEWENQIEQEQNALVPYKGDGTIVRYEGSEFIKKRKPRPKVDLDPETNRVWKLLMGKEASEDINGTHEEKEKWWEEERRVFRGRADSFIARMHLVQGDRRFSKWKGSVVDSVIGVFLTQNVSDHLSSSAFMSLVAKFPPKSACQQTFDRKGKSIMVEEPEVFKLNMNDAIKWHEKVFTHLDSQISMRPDQLTDHRRDSEASCIEKTSFTETYSQNLDEEVLSSQGSLDSLVIQANGGIGSYSSSNSEAEDSTTGFKLNGHGSTMQHMGNNTSFEEFYNQVSGSSLFYKELKHAQKQSESIENYQQDSRLDRTDNIKGTSSFNQADRTKNQQMQVEEGPLSNHQLRITLDSEEVEVEANEPCGEEYLSSSASTSRFNQPINLAESEGETTLQQNGLLRCQDPMMGLYASSSKHMIHQQEVSQQGFHGESNQPCNNHQEKMIFQLESASIKLAVTPDGIANRQNHTMQCSADSHKLTEGTLDLMDRMSVVNKQTEIGSKLNDSNSRGTNNISKVKRRKAENVKNNAIDWDSLRKQAQANGGKRERSRDTMDSLDYEALRHANVKEISEAIKERGMNNMLAERIKDFLNRLVREHGSTDLEWLRDIPPDKAKDYLLSIRGLGLKSVECVRLLTLHHVAFPVDTNVGRIAVRLGWVPLQPLPESLQLHLLELYPMLESIQKYLWPRLCKLDQRTLYELHYQLITFGKVFCTKNKPNCNACPMRGECRHFASAFASARLALAGPEEKNITSSTVPITAGVNPASMVAPMSLPPAANIPLIAGSNNSSREPIVEEPQTPEPECTEVSQSDIEDAFYEDPDEIPTIRLNIEEFTANLQTYMQENMELQEGDMSRALVALNPNAASIPTPKLKNVSRLRTEHHVYELPDSHPLLKGMDRRETDDPSPYLLAIWTPGETANSIQQPVQQCGSQEPGKLCNEKTCFSCNSVREANAKTVRGTLLIPCRTAMRGSFPLNGTYFQVNEVFADHESSLNPIDVPREWIWNLPRRIVYFGTSVSTIFKGLSTEGIQYCFWKGFVCVRGFDQKARAPKPLRARLHFPASKLVKTKDETGK